MKSLILVGFLIGAAVHAVPLQEAQNQTLVENVKPISNSTLPGSSCGVSDLDKIQEKVTVALEKQIELLLGGHVTKSGKSRRATSESSAVSRVNPDGTIKTAAAAKGNNDSPIPAVVDNSTVTPILTNGHQLPPVDPNTRLSPSEAGAGSPGIPGSSGDLPPPPSPVAGEPTQPSLPPVSNPGGVPPGPNNPPTHPVAGTGNTVQKVVSKANVVTGTSVASAIAKRSTVLQTVETSGGKAIANAESHKGANTNVQTVNANGTHVGIANAVVDNRNASGNANQTGPEVVLQNVAATGVKAVATAANNKGSGSGVQEASANGDQISIASVTSARAKRELVLIANEREILPEPVDDGSYKVNPLEDDGSYKPEPVERIYVRQRVARSPCISTKMDDNLRSLIKQLVAESFDEVKKELKL